MPDHVAHRDAVPAAQPRDQREHAVDLRSAGEDLLIGPAAGRPGLLHHLDPDRPVVDADRVAAHHVQRRLLVDRAVLVDDEVRAGAGQLAVVGRVVREGGVDAGIARRRREVQDDQPRMAEPRSVDAVVALRVGRHLGPAGCGVGNRILGDRRPGNGWRRRLSLRRRLGLGLRRGDRRRLGEGGRHGHRPRHGRRLAAGRHRPAAQESARQQQGGEHGEQRGSHILPAAMIRCRNCRVRSSRGWLKI